MRKIIHIDMDAFFAAVEMRDNPALRNIPMAVGGSRDERGVISTSNYIARKYGVRSAMPTALAKKLCPDLIIVKGRMSKYKEVSDQVFDIFYQYSNLVEGLSWDEAYIDVTESPNCQNSATLMAQEIRQKIFERTNGLTASAGIACNKLIAKMASDFNKPNGQFTVSPDKVEEFIKNAPIEKLWGVGKVTTKEMHSMGVKKCSDLQVYSRSDLIHHFGKFGHALYDFCRGIDQREVETDYERKSIGTEETFAEDLDNFEEMKAHICKMVVELQDSLEDYPQRRIKNLQVKIKYFDFKVTTIERQLPFNEKNFLLLLEDRWAQDPRSVRLLGVSVKFENSEAENPELPLFDGRHTLS